MVFECCTNRLCFEDVVTGYWFSEVDEDERCVLCALLEKMSMRWGRMRRERRGTFKWRLHF